MIKNTSATRKDRGLGENDAILENKMLLDDAIDGIVTTGLYLYITFYSAVTVILLRFDCEL